MTRPERVWQLLGRWLSPEEAKLERAACYRFQSIVARPWRRRRILLAGIWSQRPMSTVCATCCTARRAYDLTAPARTAAERERDAQIADIKAEVKAIGRLAASWTFRRAPSIALRQNCSLQK